MATMASPMSTYQHLPPHRPCLNKNGAKLASSLLPKSSVNNLSSLQFPRIIISRKTTLLRTSSPRSLSVISMAPPKPGGKAKKGPLLTLPFVCSFLSPLWMLCLCICIYYSINPPPISLKFSMLALRLLLLSLLLQ